MNIIQKTITRMGEWFVLRIGRTVAFQTVVPNPDVLNRLIQTNLSTALLHQKTFPQFKGINTGKDVVVVATGPSVKSFRPMDDCIYISVNHAFLNEKIKFDYLFAQDYKSVRHVMPQLNSYRRGECIKFYGLEYEFETPDNINYNRLIPESEAISAGALRYRNDLCPINGSQSQFTYDISTMPLGDCRSTTFAAMQFALWTNPCRIFIVGCDCAQTGHFFADELTCPQEGPDDYIKMITPWRDFKEFAHRYYPAVEIISVNPVGLKGLFLDLYQDATSI